MKFSKFFKMNVLTDGCVQYRYVIAAMGFLTFFNHFTSRIVLTMILASGAFNESGHSNTTDVSYIEEKVDIELMEERLFNISGNEEVVFTGGSLGEMEKGLLISAFYYGYTLMQIPGGWIAAQSSSRWSNGLATLLASILIGVFPTLMRSKFLYAVLAQFFIGMFTAQPFPSMAALWGAWSPESERSRMVGIAFAGASLGTCLSFYLDALIIEHLGWEVLFYISSGFTLFVAILWMLVVHDTPDKHPRISKAELEFITSNRKPSSRDIPVRAILKSLPVWGICLASFAVAWCNYTVMHQMANYLRDKFTLSTQMSGTILSAVYIVQTLMLSFAGWLTDFLLFKKVFTVKWARKINTMIGLWIPSFCTLLAGIFVESLPSAIGLNVIAASLISFTDFGFVANILDIAPSYSGFIYGIMNTVCNIPGFLAPQTTGFILQNYAGRWEIVFWISAAVQILFSIPFIMWSTGTEQDWTSKNSRETLELKEASDVAGDCLQQSQSRLCNCTLTGSMESIHDEAAYCKASEPFNHPEG